MALESTAFRDRCRRLADLGLATAIRGLPATDPHLREALRLLRDIAPTDCSVFANRVCAYPGDLDRPLSATDAAWFRQALDADAIEHAS
jgi:hypothetical protein